MTLAKHLPLLAALLVGIGIGFVIPPKVSEQSLKAPTSIPASEKTSSSSFKTTDKGNHTSMEQTGDTHNFALSLSEAANGISSSGLNQRKYHKLYGLIADLTPGQIPQLLLVLEGNPTLSKNVGFLNLFFGRWAELDPQAALNYYETHKHTLPKQPGNALHTSILSGWAVTRPEEALAWAQKNLKPQEFNNTLNSIIERVAEENPAAALRIYETQTIPPRFGDISYNLMSRMVDHDPQAAAANAMAIQDKNKRRQAAQAVAGIWIAKDPEATLRWIRPIQDKALKQALLNKALDSWSRVDLDASLVYIKTLNNTEKLRILQNVIQSTSQEDPQKALEILALLPPGETRDNSLTNLLTQWSHSDPATATEYLLSMEPSALKQRILSKLVPEIVKTDLDRGLQLVELITNPEQRRTAYARIASEWSRTDPTAALQYAGKLPETDRTQYIKGLLEPWTHNDLTAALQAVRSFEDITLKISALNTMIGLLSRNDPKHATELLEDIPPDQRNQAIRTLAYNWTLNDPQAVAQWAATLSDEHHQRCSANHSLISLWGRNDPEAAAIWLKTLPKGHSRDESIRSFAQHILRTDPGAAVLWSASITDPEQRNEILTPSLNSWFRYDPIAATEWINSTNFLTSEQKEQLLTPPKGNNQNR